MANYAVPDATSRAIQAYIDSLGPKPGPPDALANATPWQQQQAMALAEAEAREVAGGPGYYLPGGVVTETTSDTDLPGHALAGPQNVFRSYPELVQQLASEQNRGRKVVVLAAHGGQGGLSTAMGGDLSLDARGQVHRGPLPDRADMFSLQRFLSDLPPHYQQAVLATCNPRYVLGQDNMAFLDNAALGAYPEGFADKPVTYRATTGDQAYSRGRDVGTANWTWTPNADWRFGGATVVAPDWIGLTTVSNNRDKGSFPDVPILAGDGTAQGTDQLSDQDVQFTPDQRTRAVAVLNAALGQVPRYLAEDQLANYNATLGAPEMQLPPRAQGGPVQAGEPYQVGEQGPELFLPADPSAAHPVFTYLQALSPLRGG